MLASTLESQRQHFSECELEIQSEAQTFEESKNEEILALESELQALDKEVDAQIESLDQAREYNEQVRSEFAACLQNHSQVKKENKELKRQVEEKDSCFDTQI